MVVWKVGLCRVTVEEEEEEFSLYEDVGEALAAHGELEDFLGISDAEEVRLIGVKQHPKTGELLMVTLKSEVTSG